MNKILFWSGIVAISLIALVPNPAKAVLSDEIRGTIFEDGNNNHQKDPSEVGLMNWQVYLDLDYNGSLEPTDISQSANSSGNFSFSNLNPYTTYTVRQVQQSGWMQTTPSYTEDFKYTAQPGGDNLLFGNISFNGGGNGSGSGSGSGSGPSGGGPTGGSGGGGNGIGGTPSETPPGSVLGETTSAPSVKQMQPQVLGESVGLPTTGSPLAPTIAIELFVLIFSALLITRKSTAH